MNELQKEILEKNTVRNLTVSDEDLKNEDLQGLRADSLQFCSVDLRDADLSKVRLRNCRMEEVFLENAVFQNANIRMCQWQDVRAKKADFSHAKFENSSASGCVFDDANFMEASLVDTDFSRASFQRANLSHAVLTGAVLRGADLRGADLKNATLVDTDLRGADLTGADLEGADLAGADLRGAILDEALEPAQERGPFSPELEQMAVAVGPVVAKLLRTGEEKGLLDAETQARMTDALLQYCNTDQATITAPPDIDKAIDTVLQSVAQTGVAPLLEALQQQSDTPPQAVATMLEKLSADLELGEDATAEDLVSRLMTDFKQKLEEKAGSA